MTPRDLVRRSLEFAAPPSVPRQAWILPWARLHLPQTVARLHADFPDDLVAAPRAYRRPLPSSGDPYRKGVYVDEWGCRFENNQDGLIGIAREPLVREWKDLGRAVTPSRALDVDREAVDGFCAATDKFVLAGALIRPFERLCFLRTMEQALADLLHRPAGFTELLQRIHRHHLAEVEAWACTSVDAIVLMDDWGGQDRLMVAPGIWREVFKPLYREYCQVAAKAGKFVFMHSDGWIVDIIDDLIEVGVHALNCQIACMGAAELGRRFRGRLTFWGDVGGPLLLAGSPGEVCRTAREWRAHLCANGGVIAQCEVGPGARPANLFELFRAWE